MNILRQLLDIWLILILIDDIIAELRVQPKRVTAEYGTDLSLSCTFPNVDTDETIVQWLYRNITDNMHRKNRSHWRPLFLNTQSLTPKEIRYSIQQKIQQINQTAMTYSTILTLTKVTDSDEGLYMCKLFSSKTIHRTYYVQVIQSLDIAPKQLQIPADEIGQYSIRLYCILRDNRSDGRHHEIYWWHNNKRLGSQTNRHARIVNNFTKHTFISTLSYTGEPENVVGNYMCESEPLKRFVTVQLKTNNSSVSGLRCSSSFIIILWIIVSIFQNEHIE